MTTGRTGAPTLTTGRLTLRPLSSGDVDALYRISDEPLVRRYLWDDAPVSRADVEEVVESSQRMAHWFTCEEHKTKWCAGMDLFSGWRDGDEDLWERNHETLAGYSEVEPLMPSWCRPVSREEMDEEHAERVRAIRARHCAEFDSIEAAWRGIDVQNHTEIPRGGA